MSEVEQLTVEEAATRLSLNVETVRRWLRAGKLQGTRIGERRTGWRVAASEVQRVLAVEGVPGRGLGRTKMLTDVPCIGATICGVHHVGALESSYFVVTPGGRRLFACDSDCLRRYLDELERQVLAQSAMPAESSGNKPGNS